MIDVEKVIEWDEIERELRQIPLLHEHNGRTVRPYQEAEIALKEVAYSEVRPTTLYVLRNQLAVLSAMAGDVKTQGHHPLELNGGLVLRVADEKRIGLMPPIVEENKDGMYLADGAHRTSIGRWLGRTSFVAIHVKEFNKEYPYYAHPNDWDDIRIWEQTPDNPKDKKNYRHSKPELLYRNYGRLNGSRPREAGER